MIREMHLTTLKILRRIVSILMRTRAENGKLSHVPLASELLAKVEETQNQLATYKMFCKQLVGALEKTDPTFSVNVGFVIHDHQSFEEAVKVLVRLISRKGEDL